MKKKKKKRNVAQQLKVLGQQTHTTLFNVIFSDTIVNFLSVICKLTSDCAVFNSAYIFLSGKQAFSQTSSFNAVLPQKVAIKNQTRAKFTFKRLDIPRRKL